MLQSLLISAILVSPALSATGSRHIVLKGLVCSYCAQGLTKKLSTSPEVESIEVRLKSHDAVVKFKPGKALSDAVLTAAAKDSGLDVEKID